MNYIIAVSALVILLVYTVCPMLSLPPLLREWIICDCVSVAP